MHLKSALAFRGASNETASSFNKEIKHQVNFKRLCNNHTTAYTVVGEGGDIHNASKPVLIHKRFGTSDGDYSEFMKIKYTCTNTEALSV